MYSYAAGGPDVPRAVESRRSYGMESVEDDPFIVAASMQSVTSNDAKKKKQQDPSVNYGYLSQGNTYSLTKFHPLQFSSVADPQTQLKSAVACEEYKNCLDMTSDSPALPTPEKMRISWATAV